MHVFSGLDEFESATGLELGPTDWLDVDPAVQATLVTTVEIEGASKPAAVIESVVRYVG